MSKRFYITTAIDYVNGHPHLGHAYEKVVADVIARARRSLGQETFYLTGLDEHGQKVQQAALAAGKGSQAYCDELAAVWQAFAAKLDLTNDDFVRTTQPRHKQVVQAILARLHAGGHFYKEVYRGFYSTREETFLTHKDRRPDGTFDPAWGKVIELDEENYYFRLKDHQQWLIDYIDQNPAFVAPAYRRNEVLGFLKNNVLEDLCISRPKSRLEWGIPLSFDPDYVAYVWVDALVNYYSAVIDKARPDGSPWWPADLHLIGKDILTTHAVYWPTLLKSAGLPLPRTILAHGWWLIGETKMGKSLGNVVRPIEMADKYGHDAFRYFLMRDMVLGVDASFTEEGLVSRINSDLANDLGNCLNRVEKMMTSHFGGKSPAPGSQNEEPERTLAELGRATVEEVPQLIGALKLHAAIESTLQLVRATNRYLEQKAPWKAVKTQGAAAIGPTLWTAAEALRLCASLLSPVMPAQCGEVLHRLGVLDDAAGLIDKPLSQEMLSWGLLPEGARTRPAPPLFPRIESE